MKVDLFGETDPTSSTQPNTKGSQRRHSHSSRRYSRRHRGGAGSGSISETMGQLWPDEQNAAETEGEGPRADDDMGGVVKYGGNSNSYGNSDGDNTISRYSSSKQGSKPYGGSKSYKGGNSGYDSYEYKQEGKDYYGAASPTQPSYQQGKSGYPQKHQESITRQSGRHSDQHSADKATGSQDRAARLWDYGWDTPAPY
jgi:hypothetical protein